MTGGRAFGQDVDDATAGRIDRILADMTVPEQVGQLVGAPPREDLGALRDELAGHHLGSVHFGGTPYNTPERKAEFANAVQRAAIEASRFDVPLFLRAMAEHGHAAVAGSTVLPQQLGLAATRDPDLVAECARMAATEMRATGVHATSSPIADVARDARWGRVPETFGESPRLCADLTAAAVRGYQRGDPPALAITKHFPAYGEGTRGEDQAPNEVSTYTLRRVHLPAFEAGIDAATGGIMPCYNAIDGEPVHGSRRFLGDLLREELEFDGVVVADYAGAEDLHGGHGTSRSLEESLWRAVRAGIDVFPSGGAEYADALVGLVEDGELSAARIEASARRVLRLKARLGLFDDPFVAVDGAAETLGREEHRTLARRAARESMTLLTNEGVLPLADDLDSLLVAGPNADSLPGQHGGWGNVADPDPLGETVLEGLRAAADGTTVTHEPGTTYREPVDIDAARERAADADAAVVVLGEPDYVHEFRGSTASFGPDEFPTRTRLGLPEVQRDLARAVHGTGTPTVAVLVTGRALSTPWLAEHLPGLLMAYQPGSEGGAVADVLFGDHDPAGRLPVSIPRSEGQLPVRFNYLAYPTSDNDAHADPYDPLFEYGHGLSYTTFAYGSLDLSADEIGPGGTVEASVAVENTGDRDGTAVVEVFVTDVRSSRVTPVRELAGVERLELAPGERGTATVTLDGSALGVVRNGGRRVVEPGTFEVRAGDLVETFAVARRRPYER